MSPASLQESSRTLLSFWLALPLLLSVVATIASIAHVANFVWLWPFGILRWLQRRLARLWREKKSPTSLHSDNKHVFVPVQLLSGNYDISRKMLLTIETDALLITSTNE